MLIRKQIRFSLILFSTLAPLFALATPCPKATTKEDFFYDAAQKHANEVLKDHHQSLLVLRVNSKTKEFSPGVRIDLPSESKPPNWGNRIAMTESLLQEISAKTDDEEIFVYNPTQSNAVFSARKFGTLSGGFNAKKECPQLKDGNRFAGVGCEVVSLDGVKDGSLFYGNLGEGCKTIALYERKKDRTDAEQKALEPAENDFRLALGNPVETTNRKPAVDPKFIRTGKRKVLEIGTPAGANISKYSKKPGKDAGTLSEEPPKAQH